jgi:hypothetical protein
LRRGDVIENFATQSVRDLRAALGHAANLHVDSRDELLRAEAAPKRAGLQRFEHRSCRPPERAQVRLRGHVLDCLDRLAHHPGTRIGATQPLEQPALELPALLQQVRGEASRRDDLALRRARRADVEIGIEQVGRCGRVDTACFLHRAEFAEQRQRHRRRPVGDLVEEHAQAADRVIDEIHDSRHVRSGQFLEPDELALDLVGERDDGVESHHLNGARRLVHVRARVFERNSVARAGAKRRERGGAARQRFVDFTLDPRQRSEIELGGSFTQHACTPRCLSLW